MAKKDIRTIIQKQFPEFIDAVDGLSTDEIEKRISGYAKESQNVDDAKDADEGLADAKAQVAELSAPYKDAKKAINLKIRYLIQLLKDKGGNA